MKKVFCTFALSFVLFAGAAQAAVVLKPASEVRSGAIRLSDVFDGLPEGKDCEIAIAPAPGRSVTYENRVLTGLARQYSLDWQPQSMADRSILTRASIHITSDMVGEAILDKIGSSKSGKDGEVEVQFDGRFTGVNLPAEQDARFELTNFSYDNERHRFRADLVASAGNYPMTQTVTGHVIWKREIPVLSHSLPVGTVISEADLKWVHIEEDRVSDDIVAKADQLIGMETRRALSEDERIRTRDISQPRLVTRGGLVTIKVETPLMLITAQGRAMQDGAKGETVRVVNTQSNRTIEGIVESTGIVRVGDPVKMAAGRMEGAVR